MAHQDDDWEMCFDENEQEYYYFNHRTQESQWERPANYEDNFSSFVTDDNGETPLHHACRFNNFDAALSLVKAGADLYLKNKDGATPLMLSSFGVKEQQELLTASADFNAMVDMDSDVDEQGAGGRGSLGSAQTGIERLFELAKNADERFLQEYVQLKPSLSCTNRDGETLLEFLRKHNANPTLISRVKLFHCIHKEAAMPELSNEKRHVRVRVLQVTPKLEEGEEIKINLEYCSKNLGNFQPQSMGGTMSADGLCWQISPLSISKIVPHAIIKFKKVLKSNGHVISVAECPVLNAMCGSAADGEDHSVASAPVKRSSQSEPRSVEEELDALDANVVKEYVLHANTRSTIRLPLWPLKHTGQAAAQSIELFIGMHLLPTDGEIMEKEVHAPMAGYLQKKKVDRNSAWNMRWVQIKNGTLAWFKSQETVASKRVLGMMKINSVIVQREDQYNKERFKMVSGSTRKEQLTRCFSLMEKGGMNRSYLFGVDPNVIDSGEGLKGRAEWMEAIELATGNPGLDSFKEVDVMKIIDGIMRLPPSCFLMPSERAVCWECRDSCATRPDALPKFIRSVDWIKHAATAHDYISRWKRHKNVLEDLLLLFGDYADPIVRQNVVLSLDDAELGDKQLALIMPQLVQSLKWEAYDACALVNFLFNRALESPRKVGLIFFWQIIVETSYPQQHTERFVKYQQQLMDYMEPVERGRLEDQIGLWGENGAFARAAKAIIRIAKKKKQTEEEREAEEAEMVEQRQLTEEELEEQRREIARKRAEREAQSRNLGQTRIIFKVGDDLRQDCIVLEMIRIMDQLWLAEEYDLLMTPYHTAATWSNGGVLQVVPKSATLAEIHVEQTGGNAAATMFSNRDYIWDFLRQENPDPSTWETVRRNFVYSTAGYCVATHIMGIGDRHNDNVMVSKDGRMFHIDFGHILGHTKTFKGIKRENTTFVFVNAMAHVMRSGEKDLFPLFVKLVGQAYNVLRKHATYLISVFMLMIPAQLPELAGPEDIDVMVQRLKLDLTDEEAAAYLEEEINAAMNDTMKTMDFTMHIMKHKGGGKKKGQDLHTKLREMLSQVRLPEQIVLPYGDTVGRLLVDKCKVMSSATKPLWLVFENVESAKNIDWFEALDRERYAMAKDFMKAIGKEIKTQKFIVPISLYPQKKGFMPPNPDRDWTSKFKGSISQARSKLEKGEMAIPPGGVFVQSRRLSTEKGYPVFYHITTTGDETAIMDKEARTTAAAAEDTPPVTTARAVRSDSRQESTDSRSRSTSGGGGSTSSSSSNNNNAAPAYSLGVGELSGLTPKPLVTSPVHAGGAPNLPVPAPAAAAPTTARRGQLDIQTEREFQKAILDRIWKKHVAPDKRVSDELGPLLEDLGMDAVSVRQKVQIKKMLKKLIEFLVVQ